MTTWFSNDLRVALLAGLALAAGCKGGQAEVAPLPARDAGAPVALAKPAALARPTSPCAEICRITRDLRCKKAGECESHCQSMLALPVCQDEVTAFFTCLRQQPIAHWECDPDDIPAIRDRFCNPQQSAVAACMESNAAR